MFAYNTYNTSMGVKYFFHVLQNICPDAFQTITMKDLKDKVIAIDGSLWMYQLLCVTQHENNTAIMLKGIYHRLVYLLQYKCRPVFVFDGPPPEFKQITLSERKETKRKAETKIKNKMYENETDKRKLLRQSCNITKEHIRKCRKMLEHMGIPYIDSLGETDTQCGYLSQKNKIDYVITDDSDISIFGCDRVLIGFKTKQQKHTLINMSVVYECTPLTRQDLVYASLLLGSDYYKGVSGIGKMKTITMLKQIMETCDRTRLWQSIPTQDIPYVKEIVAYYMNPQGHDRDFQLESPKLEELFNFFTVELDIADDIAFTDLQKLAQLA